jgi:perosamine synthetase
MMAIPDPAIISPLAEITTGEGAHGFAAGDMNGDGIIDLAVANSGTDSPSFHPSFLPVANPDLSGNEKRYVNEALDEGWISSNGRFIERFERDFAEYCGTSHAISCCNGTAALHLIMVGLGIGPGDEVLVPSFTYVASANAVAYTGATPVLVESTLEHWNIDINCLEEALTPRTRGIMAVHLYGKPCDMSSLSSFAERHGLVVIEDAAEAHGARIGDQRVGSFGIAASFSFYGNKIITTGEGGMVTTNDEELAERMRLLRGQGMDPKQRYWFPVMGFNYRMTNIVAAIGCAQLERIDHLIGRRREIAKSYSDRLYPFAEEYGLQLPSEIPNTYHVHWLFSMRLPKQMRDHLMADLKRQGIDSRPFFPPLHCLPVYNDRMFHGDRDLSNAIELGRTGLNLPTFAQMREEDIDRVANSIIQFMRIHHEST